MNNPRTTYGITYYNNQNSDSCSFDTEEERTRFIESLHGKYSLKIFEVKVADALTAEQIEQMATEIRDWLLAHELWMDCRIYFNGKAYSTDRVVNGIWEFSYNNPQELFVLENEEPRRHFPYVGNILSMSFEGDLYDLINYHDDNELMEGFNAIFDKYDCYYELGNDWNLTAVYKFEVT